MFPLIAHYLRAFFFDANAAKRFLAGVGGMLGMAFGTVLAFGVPAVLAWTSHEIAQHSVVALVGALASMLPGPKIAGPEAKPEPAP